MLKNGWLRETCCGEERETGLDAYLEQSSLAAMGSLELFELDPAVRGENALGTQLEKQGFAAVPSAANPHPCQCGPACACSGYDVAQWSGGVEDTCRRCAFFWGAATTLRYGGGREGGQLEEFKGCVSATQLETPWASRANLQELERFAEAIAESIATFVLHFYGSANGRPN